MCLCLGLGNVGGGGSEFTRVHVAVQCWLCLSVYTGDEIIDFPSFRLPIPTVFSMSRAADTLEQDVGGGEGDSLPTYENLAELHGPNSRYG